MSNPLHDSLYFHTLEWLFKRFSQEHQQIVSMSCIKSIWRDQHDQWLHYCDSFSAAIQFLVRVETLLGTNKEKNGHKKINLSNKTSGTTFTEWFRTIHEIRTPVNRLPLNSRDYCLDIADYRSIFFKIFDYSVNLLSWIRNTMSWSHHLKRYVHPLDIIIESMIVFVISWHN